MALFIDWPLAAVSAERHRHVVGGFGDHGHWPRQLAPAVVSVLACRLVGQARALLAIPLAWAVRGDRKVPLFGCSELGAGAHKRIDLPCESIKG
jgi:hypothetical protein